MGQYINEIDGKHIGSSFTEKRNSIKNIKDSVEYPGTPKIWEENIVCIIDNGPFAAAAYIYNESELVAFSDPNDIRTKAWFNVPNAEQYAN